MGLCEERFLDASEYLCCICQDVYEDPVESDCGHYFCNECASTLSSNPTIELTAQDGELYLEPYHCLCPMDRSKIKTFSSPNDEFQLLYGTLQLRCKNFPYCDKILTISEYEDHEIACEDSLESFEASFSRLSTKRR